jgi:tetratricopeptide (TPR) repeat protein
MRAALTAVDAAADAEPWQRARIAGWLGSLLVERAMRQRGATQRETFDEAAALLERARSLLVQAGLDQSLDWALATNALGLARKKLGDLDTAERLYRDVLDLYDRRLAADDARTAAMHVNLGGIHEARGELEGALTEYEHALELLRAALPPTAQHVVQVEANVLGTLMRLGRLDGLVARYDDLLPRQIALFGDRGPVVGSSYQRRGMLHLVAGAAVRARSDLELALLLLRASYGDDAAAVRDVQQLLAKLPERK